MFSGNKSPRGAFREDLEAAVAARQWGKSAVTSERDVGAEASFRGPGPGPVLVGKDLVRSTNALQRNLVSLDCIWKEKHMS